MATITYDVHSDQMGNKFYDFVALDREQIASHLAENINKPNSIAHARMRDVTQNASRARLEFLGLDYQPELTFDGMMKIMTVPSEKCRSYCAIDYQEMLEEVKVPGRTRHRKVRSEDTGDEIDIGRAVAGDSAVWIDSRKVKSKAPLMVNMFVSVNRMSSVRAEAIMLSNSVACALAMRLDACGIRTRIFATTSTSHLLSDDRSYHRCAVCVKNFSDDADPESLMAGLGPQTYRSIFFLCYTTHGINYTPQYVDEYMGRTETNHVASFVARHGIETKNTKTVHLPFFHSKEQGIRYVNQMIEDMSGLAATI